MEQQIEAHKKLKPITETMAQPNHPDTIEKLRGWRKPRGAYVLLEMRKIFNTSDLVEPVLTSGLYTLDLENRPGQLQKLEAALLRGMKILDYGNFPSLNDENPRRRQKAELYSGQERDNPWEAIRKRCDLELGKVARAEAERSEFERKLEAKNKEIEALKRKGKVEDGK